MKRKIKLPTKSDCKLPCFSPETVKIHSCILNKFKYTPSIGETKLRLSLDNSNNHQVPTNMSFSFHPHFSNKLLYLVVSAHLKKMFFNLDHLPQQNGGNVKPPRNTFCLRLVYVTPPGTGTPTSESCEIISPKEALFPPTFSTSVFRNSWDCRSCTPVEKEGLVGVGVGVGFRVGWFRVRIRCFCCNSPRLWPPKRGQEIQTQQRFVDGQLWCLAKFWPCHYWLVGGLFWEIGGFINFMDMLFSVIPCKVGTSGYFFQKKSAQKKHSGEQHSWLIHIFNL